MRLATVRDERGEIPVLVDPKRGVAELAALLPGHTGDLMALLGTDAPDRLPRLAADAPDTAFRPAEAVTFTAPYRRPRKIWGIGLNYVAHAADLTETVPEEPASFMKGDHTIIGPGDPIPLPRQSERVTAEAELGLVIGRPCRDVEPEDALDHVFGVTTLLDQTAEDILARNPRFLTRSKNFPGFLSFGPEIVELAEVIEAVGDLAAVEVSTVLNGEVRRSNTVGNMRYDPAFLVSFHSKVMPLFPGDVICTGTPGAVVLSHGDVAECRIPGVGTLRNPVIRA
ncbi:fumarylacetoacetate hydrolase family protein [Nonomuraea sp. K274]|uniref:Fumarylacetoacetate hydrolase family protein n=1 Tax=Nonomuraea cypriaca TaxID=1187855 RepID=A0A931F5L6_9ACTN|nr:fumarylacetoacetate hydrolase family protein [Nonomuraea cypriaca]MBF8193822.1 fumarylacetoacetate hydrolase family protein [Nonomuraea cypriaca]